MTTPTTSVAAIITTAVKSLATKPEYLKLVEEIKTELAKIALNAAVSLNGLASHYQISLRNNSGISSDLLLQTLAKEVLLADLCDRGDCVLKVNGNHLVISFSVEYIDNIVAAAMTSDGATGVRTS